MGAVEIVLLIAGGMIFILSFILPEQKEKMTDETRKQYQGEIKELVTEEIGSAKSRIDDMVDETVTYSIEKAERSLERISNEKIMAVGEYSDTVLNEIDKSHKEILFLYDMLSDKHNEVKNTVSEVTKTVRAAGQAAAETEQESNADKEPESTFTVLQPAAVLESGTAPDLSFIVTDEENGQNNNDRILEMHSQGKSNVAIARELGLGVGEVKLVIDLFKTCKGHNE